MLKPISKLYDKVSKDRDGRDVVTALFVWDGEQRAVKVPAGKYKVGDVIEVHLREVYSKDKQQGYKWWEVNEEA